MTTPEHPVRSREHLLHLLAEAAELEHNLLCSYLFAAFSLKQGADEDLDPQEAAAVGRWRKMLMGVCREEMVHLAQVCNLMLAVGARPHLDRPNLPAAPGYHPAGIRVELMPFDLDTLDHFIFLERPEGSDERDAECFAVAAGAPRESEAGMLMPSAPEYETIGQFYTLLDEGFVRLAASLGEAGLFIGPADCQMAADELGVDALSVVTDLASARHAIHLVVVQGEGASGHDEGSHHGQFIDMRREFLALRDRRPSFHPSRPVARNPAMRRPVAADRVHVTAATARPLLDAANAVYSLMLRCLVEVFETSRERKPALREALLGGAMGLMQALTTLSTSLTLQPAGDAADGGNAGVTFAMLRSTEGVAPGVDAAAILRQRFSDIEAQLPRLALPNGTGSRLGATLAGLRGALESVASAAAG